MDDRLALSVTHADGRVTRWGPDEVDAGSIPSDLQFSTAMPGGYRDLSCSLLRRIDLDYPDQGLFDNVRAYGPGNQTAWDGRFTQFPRSHGQGFSITPGAVGWSAHLRDDPSFREVYIDRDLSRWGAGTMVREQNLIAATYALQGSGSPNADGFVQSFTGAWVLAHKPWMEAWYDAGAGVAIGRVRGGFDGGANLTAADLNWYVQTFLSTDSAPGAIDTSGDQWPGTAGVGTFDVAATTSTRRYAAIDFAYTTGPAGSDGVLWDLLWTNLRVFGNHGLTIRGSTAASEGFYASDVIADIVERAAPLLTTTGVETSDFVIPQLAFPDPVTAEDAITLTNAYHLWEWGVYDDRDFFYRAPDNERLVWEARLDRGAFLDLEGDTAEQIYNGVYVTYTDATGARKSAGPTGSGADLETSTLADTSETNPVNAHGIPRRWAILNISQPTDETGAQKLGYTWLGEHSLPQRRGNLTLTGSVTHPTEGDVPVWRIKAGDSVRISDHPADVPRRIISTSYSHGTRSVSLALDNTSFKLDAILERALGVQMMGVL